MSKVQINDLDQDLRYRIVGDFYDIVTHLEKKKDVVGFFMGLLTPSESIMFARRIQVAKLLLAGKSYDNITKELGVGKTTIMSIRQWIDSESQGFREQIEKQQKRQKRHEGDKRKMYDRILSPYGQIEIVKKMLDM